MKALFVALVFVFCWVVQSQTPSELPADVATFYKPGCTSVKTCHQQTGGWQLSPFFNQLDTSNPFVWYFYYRCRTWYPTWSRCVGGCDSSWNFTYVPNQNIGPTYDTDCKCCRATKISIHTPNWAYCQAVVTINWGCFPLDIDWLQGGFVPHPQIDLSDYNYYLADGCQCCDCPGPGSASNANLPEVNVASECQIKDRPEQPIRRGRVTLDEVRRAAIQAGARLNSTCTP